MTIIIFIIILGLLVLIHELGHFIVAKKNGILVEEFGFGFPPRLFSLKIGETRYSFNLLPIGGFVKLYGEEYADVNERKSPLANRAFVNKKPWQKSLVIIAGVIGNFLLGWILVSYLFTQGVPVPLNRVKVESVVKNSPAEKSGLKINDYITELKKDGKTYAIKTTTDISGFSKKFAGEEVVLTVIRDNKTFLIKTTPRKVIPAGQGPLGIAITSFTVSKYPWYQAPFYGLIESASMTKRIIVELLKTLFLLVTFQRPQLDITGPIGIARYTGEAIKFGLNAVLELMAILSLNLAVVNILPFPALDGGRLVFVIYEWVTKKRVNSKFERNMNLAGIIILLSLAVLISISDVLKIIK